jgi:hypothetical protein
MSDNPAPDPTQASSNPGSITPIVEPPAQVSREEFIKLQAQMDEEKRLGEKYKDENYKYRERERQRKEEEAQKTGKWEEVYNESQARVIELQAENKLLNESIKTRKKQAESALDARLSSLSPEKKELIDNAFKNMGSLDPFQKTALLEAMLSISPSANGTPLNLGQPVGMTGNNSKDNILQELRNINESGDKEKQGQARSKMHSLLKNILS